MILIIQDSHVNQHYALGTTQLYKTQVTSSYMQIPLCRYEL